jgi:RNA polymerase sigma factor (sigma-70 family)
MKQDEQAVINRILDGEQALYGVLIDRYKEGLYRHCFRFVRDEDKAEDITQQAFIKAYIHLEKYDQVHAFSTWLYKIATNEALEELRRKKALPLDDTMTQMIIDGRPLPERTNIYAELHEAVDRLPDKQRAVVTLHYFEGKRYEEIAKELGSSIGSIKSWMNRAKKQLKELLS